MEQDFKVPVFETEAEEARWWFDNRELLAERFVRAAASGQVTRSTIARRGSTPTTTIRLDPTDIEKARVLAEQKGMKYQTYLKMLIHEALLREEKIAS